MPNDSKLEAPKAIAKSNSENSLNNVNLADSVLPDQLDNAGEGQKVEEAEATVKVHSFEARSPKTSSTKTTTARTPSPTVPSQPQ